MTGFLRNDVRLVFKFMENGKRRDTSFTELCYCCHGGMITSPERNVYKDILEFRNTVRKDRQLDHLDGFVRNNTGLNLSMVSSAVNK